MSACAEIRVSATSHPFQLIITELKDLRCLILEQISLADIKPCLLRQGNCRIKACSTLELLLKPRIILELGK